MAQSSGSLLILSVSEKSYAPLVSYFVCPVPLFCSCHCLAFFIRSEYVKCATEFHFRYVFLTALLGAITSSPST
jgi:hypothetical protein